MRVGNVVYRNWRSATRNLCSDDAGVFAGAVEGSQLARGRILDWFHIAMKFQAAQSSVFASKMIDSMEQNRGQHGS